jgi:hypothetical protein
MAETTKAGKREQPRLVAARFGFRLERFDLTTDLRYACGY